MKHYLNLYLGKDGEYSLGAGRFRSAEEARQSAAFLPDEHIGVICVTTRREVGCVPAQPYASVAAILADAYDALAPKQDDNPWIPHRGGNIPCASQTVVEARLRNGSRRVSEAGHLRWYYSSAPLGRDYDIVAWRLHRAV